MHSFHREKHALSGAQVRRQPGMKLKTLRHRQNKCRQMQPRVMGKKKKKRLRGWGAQIRSQINSYYFFFSYSQNISSKSRKIIELSQHQQHFPSPEEGVTASLYHTVQPVTLVPQRCAHTGGLRVLPAQTGVALGIDLDLCRTEMPHKGSWMNLCHLKIHLKGTIGHSSFNRDKAGDDGSTGMERTRMAQKEGTAEKGTSAVPAWGPLSLERQAVLYLLSPTDPWLDSPCFLKRRRRWVSH